MTDVSLLNYFGAFDDFENLKKWFRINSELYKEIILSVKERSDLELDYSNRLSKINARISKTFTESTGSVGILWSKTAQLMNEESDVHKILGSQIGEELYKPLIKISTDFDRLKKPIEAEIDKCARLYEEKRDETFKLKKNAFVASKKAEKAFECSEDYKMNHPSSVTGLDKEKSKIEKQVLQCSEICSKIETEYIESSLAAESLRHRWEHSYISGLEKLQEIETKRLSSMKSIIEAYHKCISIIPTKYVDISTRLLRELGAVNITEDLFENAMRFTNKNPNIYKTEQLMLDFFAESRDNRMHINRRKENLTRNINVMNQHQQTCDNLRTGILKMLTAYEETADFADDATRLKAKREFSKAQGQMNLLSSTLYKLQLTLNHFDNKPEPINPLISLGVKIVVTEDKNGLIQSVLESNPGAILPFYKSGTINRSSSSGCSSIGVLNSYDLEYDNFYPTEEEEPVPPYRPPRSLKSDSSSNSSSKEKNILKTRVPVMVASDSIEMYNNETRRDSKIPLKPPRPLPMLPPVTRCKALHSFTGRDEQELSFDEGDIIVINNKLDDIWWEGQLKGVKGLVPVNYVMEL